MTPLLRPVAPAAEARGPRMTDARAPMLREIEVLDEHGQRRPIHIPAERPLTVFVDKRELVTLMTLGAAPEMLVLGYLRNQRLVADASEVESITVDWAAGDCGAGVAAVKTHAGIVDLHARTDKRVVTTGCGQGSVFGDLMDGMDGVRVPHTTITQSRLHTLLDTIRRQDTVYKSAGTVHGCALFTEDALRIYVEDVGRHNAIDVIAGWLWMNEVRLGADAVFYTTGRLTSEMVMKAAHIGVPIIVSRNGMTAMGYEMALRLGMTLFGRAANKHFIGYVGMERFDAEPQARRSPVSVVSG